jgi:hypothetical protein
MKQNMSFFSYTLGKDLFSQDNQGRYRCPTGGHETASLCRKRACNGRLMKVIFLRKTMKARLERTAFREVPALKTLYAIELRRQNGSRIAPG